MNRFCILSDGTTEAFASLKPWLARLDELVGKGGPLTLSVPRWALEAIRELLDLLNRHAIKLVLEVDSDPEAMDYLSQTSLGGAIGSAAGAAGGVWALSALSRLGYLIPGVGWYLTAATLLGCVLGASAGFAVTRMGLRVRFVHADTVELELVPSMA